LVNTTFFIIAAAFAILLGSLGLMPIEQVYAQDNYIISMSTGDLPDRSIGISSDCTEIPQEKCVFSVSEIRFIPNKKLGLFEGPEFNYICIDNLKPNSNFHNCSYLSKYETSWALGFGINPESTTYVEGGELAAAALDLGGRFGAQVGIGGKLDDFKYRLVSNRVGIPIAGNLLLETGIGSVTAAKYVVVGITTSGFDGTVEFIGQKQPGMKLVVGSGEQHGKNDIQCFSINAAGMAADTVGCGNEFHDALILSCDRCHKVGYRNVSNLSSPFPEPTFVSTYTFVQNDAGTSLNPEPFITPEEIEGILSQSEKLIQLFDTASSKQMEIFSIDELIGLLENVAVEGITEKVEAELLNVLEDLKEQLELLEIETGIEDLSDTILKLDEIISKLELLKDLDAELAKIVNVKADVDALTSKVDTITGDIDRVLNTPIQFSDSISPVPGVTCNVALGEKTSFSCTGSPTIPKTCKNFSPVSGISCTVCIGQGAGTPSCGGEWGTKKQVCLNYGLGSICKDVHVKSGGHFHVH